MKYLQAIHSYLSETKFNFYEAALIYIIAELVDVTINISW
jgi:hypothetical protein